MHHCATAAILAAGGVGKRLDAPKSHEHVAEHYGKLVEGEPGFLGESGRVLNRGRTDREIADYALGTSISAAESAELAADARRFIEACAARWSLRASGA
jgi:hypothetical protein